LEFIDILVGGLLRRTPAIEIGLNSQLMPVAWGITVALAVAPEVTATRASSPLDDSVSLESGAAAANLCQHAGAPDVAGCLFLERLAGVDVTHAWFPNPSGYAAVFIAQAPKVVAAFVMMAIVALLGYRRQEF
jgi:hypothetical protein